MAWTKSGRRAPLHRQQSGSSNIAVSLIDYVPTQVFTEYIRFYGVEGSKPPDGIVFNSSMRTDGKCVVLFKGPEISSESDCQASGAWLKYTGHSIHKITGVSLEHTVLDDLGES